MTINHLGISGGKDSTALLLWAVHESGYPRESLRATFADTGNEIDLTYDYVRMLGEKVHPIEWLKPDRDFYELAAKRKRFPSAKARFCTQELKMEPSRRYVYGLLDQGHEVLLHTGVRASESTERAKLSPRDFDTWYALPVLRPLLSWSLEDVWAIHERYGIPPNPLYALGMRRVGCGPCIMSRKAEVKRLAELFPERIERIRAAELAMENANHIGTFFARDRVPLCQRSRTVLTAAGEQVTVPTIDDVVRWSHTDRGGAQYLLEFDEEPPTCSHTTGACE